MNQDFRGARIRTGNGRAGGHGGDVASHNSYRQSHTGDYYNGPVTSGDQFNGPIHGSNVGGRNNVNTVNNAAIASDTQSTEEAEITARLQEARKRLEAKRAKERVDKLKAELAAAMAELGEDE